MHSNAAYIRDSPPPLGSKHSSENGEHSMTFYFLCRVIRKLHLGEVWRNIL